MKDIRAERMKILGDNLSTIRKAKGLSRQQLATVLNVEVSTIGAYENAKKLPPLDKIFELANLFEVSVVDLIGDNGHNPDYQSPSQQLFNYRYNRAVKVITAARIKLTELNGRIYLTPSMEISTEQGDDGKIKVFVEYNIGFAPVSIQSREDFVQVVEDTEEHALFDNTTFKQTFIERFYKKK